MMDRKQKSVVTSKNFGIAVITVAAFSGLALITKKIIDSKRKNKFIKQKSKGPMFINGLGNEDIGKSCLFLETEEKPFGLCMFYELDDMYEVMKRGRVQYYSCYEIGSKGYLEILLDGNEKDAERYGGYFLSQEELKIFEKNVLVNTMYFEFDDCDNLNGFLKNIIEYEIPVIQCYDVFYADLSEIEKSMYERYRFLASEYYGKEINSLSVFSWLKELFEQVR